MQVSGGPSVVTILGLGGSSCIALLLVLYNVLGLVRHVRSSLDDRPASGLSMAAWALSFVSLFLGPCAFPSAVLSLVLSRVESGRIYAERSSIRSSLPCQMANINGIISLILFLLLTIVALVGLL